MFLHECLAAVKDIEEEEEHDYPGVYLLHFKDKISDKHTTQHYTGYADNINKRVAAHKKGRGSRLTGVAKEKGIDFEVSHVWKDADRNFERKIKNQKNAPRHCPTCKAAKASGTKR